jgi:hypothetical protein
MTMRRLAIVPISLLVTILLAAGLPAHAQRTAYEGGEVADGATISGEVTWKGPKPKIEPFEINKNTDVCDTGGNGKRTSNRLLVSESGGVANAVVYLEGVKKGKPLGKAGAKLDQKGCRYEPHIVVLPRRAELTMSSSDAILHNIHMFDAASYNIPFPDKDTLVKKMRRAGVARVRCDAGHGWMSAYVFVVRHPYYAVTDASGGFTLSDVPPGKYTIKMWHESWEVAKKTEKDGVTTGYQFKDPIEQSQEVEVSAGGKASVSFTLSQ